MPYYPPSGGGSGTSTTFGLLASRPAANSVTSGTGYFATDDNGGTLYVSNATSWYTAGPRGVELAHTESLTTYTTASLAASAYEDVTGVSITFTPRDRNVLLEAQASLMNSSNAAARPRVVIRKSDNTFIAANGYNAASTNAQIGPRVTKRLILGTDITTGVSVTYKLSVLNASGATASTVSLFAPDAGAGPFHLRAEEV